MRRGGALLPVLPLLGLLPLLGGCAADAASCRGLPGEPVLNAELFFGLTRTGGPPVSDAEWRDFLASEVTPRFPDGLTVFDAAGQWRDPAAGAVTREASRVVLVSVPAARGGAVAALQRVQAAYRAKFAQKSVGLSITRACAAF